MYSAAQGLNPKHHGLYTRLGCKIAWTVTTNLTDNTWRVNFIPRGNSLLVSIQLVAQFFHVITDICVYTIWCTARIFLQAFLYIYKRGPASYYYSFIMHHSVDKLWISPAPPTTQWDTISMIRDISWQKLNFYFPIVHIVQETGCSPVIMFQRFQAQRVLPCWPTAWIIDMCLTYNSVETFSHFEHFNHIRAMLCRAISAYLIPSNQYFNKINIRTSIVNKNT